LTLKEDQPPDIGDLNSTVARPEFPDIPASAGQVIGLGIDIVARERVERMLENHGDRFLERCFTPDEREYCMSRPDPAPDLAVRLAVKEACFKAIGGRRGMGLGWRDFEVVIDEQGVPWLRLNDEAAKRAESIGVGKVWISLTHEDLWSAAVVVLTGA
jgi:holo-[acyl-carrier protein] synthase